MSQLKREHMKIQRALLTALNETTVWTDMLGIVDIMAEVRKRFEGKQAEYEVLSTENPPHPGGIQLCDKS